MRRLDEFSEQRRAGDRECQAGANWVVGDWMSDSRAIVLTE